MATFACNTALGRSLPFIPDARHAQDMTLRAAASGVGTGLIARIGVSNAGSTGVRLPKMTLEALEA